LVMSPIHLANFDNLTTVSSNYQDVLDFLTKLSSTLASKNETHEHPVLPPSTLNLVPHMSCSQSYHKALPLLV